MSYVAIGLVGLLILLAIAISFTLSLIHLIVTLAVAGLIGWLADLAIPGQLPYGWLGAVVAGLVGGWLGSLILGTFGPTIYGVNIIPTFLGAAVLALGAEVIGKKALPGRR